MKQRAVILIIVLIAAITLGAVIYSAVTKGTKDESLVQQDIAFMLLDEKGGTDGIPDAFSPGREWPVRMGIANGYNTTEQLTAEILLMNVSYEMNARTNRYDILGGKVIRQEPVTVGAYEMKLTNGTISIEPNDTAWNQARFVLYKGSAPSRDLPLNDRLNQSYRVLWIPIQPESDSQDGIPLVVTSS